MTDVERLIALEYVKKRISQEVAELKPRVMEGFAERMATEVGGDGEPRRSFGYWLDGKKLAAFWFPMSKAEPERTETVVACYDWDAALADENPDFAEWLAAHVKAHIGELAEQYVRETGDALDGVHVEVRTTPAVPPRAKAGQMRINAARIEEAMRPQLPSVVAGLLEGGDE